MKGFVKVVMALMLGTITLYAHGGTHTHKHTTPKEVEISKVEIKKIAKQEVKKLALNAKIDRSWLFSPIDKMKKKKFGKKYEWVVHFKNEKIKDLKKQTLYIFLDLQGKMMGANYTGN